MTVFGEVPPATPITKTARRQIPWWKEPTRDQWYTFVAAWLGWTLDAFDFTVFLLIMHPIAETFGVSMTAVTFVFTITLWMRLLGATASGWVGDRMGRKTPLMIAILGYSLCNFAAGFSPTFMFLFVARAILGLFMGAEWPAGCALAMETWPQSSRGFMSGVLQGSWGLGFLLSFAIYGLFYNMIGWRGMLWVGVLPALAVVYVRFFVKEPEVLTENRRIQRAEKREVKAPLISIFRRGMILNTLNACWFMASGFVLYYSINVLFATHLQVDLKLSPGADRRDRCGSESRGLPRQCELGLGGRQVGPQDRADPSRADRDPDRPTLSAHRQFHADLVGIRGAGCIRERRLRQPGSKLSLRAVPDGGARDSRRLLLSPGCGLGRPGGADPGLLRHDLPAWLRCSDVDRNDWRGDQFCRRYRARSGNQGQGTRRGYCRSPDCDRGYPMPGRRADQVPEPAGAGSRNRLP